MRRRILRTSLTATLTLIAVMTLTMLWLDWVGTTATYERRLDAELDRIAERLHDRFHAGNATLSEAQVAGGIPPGRRVDITFVDGGRLVVGEGGVEGPAAELAVDDIGTIRLVDTTGNLARAHVVATTLIVGVGLLLALVATLVLRRMARRVTEPFDDLVRHAERLRDGDLRLLDTRYGIEEFDRLVAALNASVVRVQELLADERRLATDASHQLKTPLTALTLRLDELAEYVPGRRERAEVLLALDQVERLASVVDDMLVDRRRDTRHLDVPLRVVLDQQLAEWKPLFAASGRALRLSVELDRPCPVEPGPVGQVVATLLENSLHHGEGTTTVTANDRDSTPWVEVADEGAGVPDALATSVFERSVSGTGGTGLGLSAAQDAAVSMGGRLALVRRRPAHFRLFLNLREDPPAVGPEAEERPEGESDHVGRDVVRDG